jgi:hypothetical protein
MSNLLVRITKSGLTLTMDCSANQEAHDSLRAKVHEIGHYMAGVYDVRLEDACDVEILTSRTADKLERMGELLNDCRNLLIDMEDGNDEEVCSMLDALSEELGL